MMLTFFCFFCFVLFFTVFFKRNLYSEMHVVIQGYTKEEISLEVLSIFKIEKFHRDLSHLQESDP